MWRLTVAFWWLILGLWLLVHHLGAHSAVHAAAAPAAPAAPAPKPRQITGVGQTAVEAKQHALEKAAAELTARVHLHYPSLSKWKLLPAYVEQHWIDGPGEPGQDVDLDQLQAKSWTLTLWPPDLHVLTRLARSEDRLCWGLWLLPLLLIGLGVLTGYLRLERHTQGRHTIWLRAAALLTAATTWTAWWCIKDFLVF